MTDLTLLVKVVAVVAAAIYLGNWFLAEAKRIQASGRPAYHAYLSVPGIIILLVILLPIILRLTGYL
ncbi:MAG: hypothetical protein ACOZBW_15075 [Thermodesulfobacteriota bacterium]